MMGQSFIKVFRQKVYLIVGLSFGSALFSDYIQAIFSENLNEKPHFLMFLGIDFIFGLVIFSVALFFVYHPVETGQNQNNSNSNSQDYGERNCNGGNTNGRN
ncbi:MAG: hypothetical protein ACYDAO_05270 [Thermoplasmataceae archaeon]